MQLPDLFHYFTVTVYSFNLSKQLKTCLVYKYFKQLEVLLSVLDIGVPFPKFFDFLFSVMREKMSIGSILYI